MPSVFISYRRDDSAGEAGRLADTLEARFGRERVFRDVEDIPAGQDFAREIDRTLARTDTLLVIIGREWLAVKDASGRRRLDDTQDFVRLEIAAALAHGIRVLSVLVRGAFLCRCARPMCRGCGTSPMATSGRWRRRVTG